MLEYVPLLGLLVTIIIALISDQQTKKVIHQQAEEIKQQAAQLEELRKGRRRELIEKYYPSLAENLRLSLPDTAHMYHKAYEQQDALFLKVLIEMANQSTLSIIESLDKNLHDDLKNILDDFIPAEKELDARKDESWKEIPRKWQKWVDDNYNEIPWSSIAPETLVNELSGILLWPLWMRDENLARQNFDRVYERRFLIGDDEKRSSRDRHMIYNEIKRIAEEEWKPIRDGYDKLQKNLHDLVELKILPRMDSTLKSLGE